MAVNARLGIAAALPLLLGAAGAHPEDAPGTHNMAVFGDKTVFASHLPMFDGVDRSGKRFTAPHRFQVILALGLPGEGAVRYAADRKAHPAALLYTLGPEQFVLSRLSTPAPVLTKFRGRMFRGHLERGGPVVPGLAAADLTVTRVVHFREFDPTAAKPKALTYILFGGGGEHYLAHWISGPPDFDQLLAVQLDGAAFSDAELAAGVIVEVPALANRAAARWRGKTPVAATTTGATPRPLTLSAAREIYFEEGELLVPPTFGDTPAEAAD